MPTFGEWPNIVEVTRRLDPDGGIAQVAEWLSKYNPVLQDIPWVEGNLPGGHRFVSREALPTVSWRRLNAGVAGSASKTQPLDESCGILEAYNYIDVDLAELNGNSAAWRKSEDMAFVEAFNQEFCRALFYESIKDNPERIHGLSARLGIGTGAPYTSQMISADSFGGASASGTGCRSIWLIGWSPDKVFGIYPKGSMAGFNIEDLGKQLLEETATGGSYSTARLLAYVTRFQWKCGLCVKDYRYLVRIHDIDTDLSNSPDVFYSGSKNLYQAMMQALTTIYSMEGVSPVFYMSRQVFARLNLQLTSNNDNMVTWVTQAGRLIPTFVGVPIRVIDALEVSESAI